MRCGTTIPILRIFDEEKAREFYVEFLGFVIVTLRHCSGLKRHRLARKNWDTVTRRPS